MRWGSVTNKLSNGVIQVQLMDDARVISFDDATRLLRENREFQLWLSRELGSAPMSAFYWETPPVTAHTMVKPFEYVVIDAPVLARRQPDRESFAARFRQTSGQVARFHNLGGDAILVTPVPVGENDDYAHLGSFLRSAPEEQICAIWRALFDTVTEMLSDSPIWISTSGLGIAWLHFRLDSVPKYYNHAPYRSGHQ